MSATFRSLGNANYRLWAGGALVSNIGTWMQRVAQDWIVLTQLTHHSATAVGVVMALQFGPPLALLPLTGLAADWFDRRTILLLTQALMGLLALGLGLLTLTGAVRLWQVDVFALLLGCVAAFDSPARQAFVGDLVGEGDLANAVALNSTSFNAARMIGPAVAGTLIASVGTAWAFLANAGSFLGVIVALAMLDRRRMTARPAVVRRRGGMVEGFRYVAHRPDLRTAVIMLALIGTFGFNFPIFISTMAVGVFHMGPGRFGLLTSAMATGSVIGALLSAGRPARFTTQVLGAAAFGVMLCVDALVPTYWSFGAALVFTGVAAQTFTTSNNAVVQLSTDPAMRGRVMAILMAVAMGSTLPGGPLAGWLADHFGPRWAIALAGASGIVGASIGARYVARAAKAVPRTAGEVLTDIDDTVGD